MAIKGNISVGVQDLAASAADKVIHNISTRTAITAASLHNKTVGAVAITIYESPNGTSASGKEVAKITLAASGTAGDSKDITEIIGQGYAATTTLVAVVTTVAISAGDVNAKLTYTQYTGAS